MEVRTRAPPMGWSLWAWPRPRGRGPAFITEAGEGGDELSWSRSVGKSKLLRRPAAQQLRAWALGLDWVQILALPLTSYRTLSKWLILQEAWLSLLRHRHNTTPAMQRHREQWVRS